MDKEKDKLTTFSLSIYGDVTSYNEVMCLLKVYMIQ